MTRLASPQATPEDIENALRERDMYIRVATAVWGADLTPAQINEAWEETAAHVRLHTPPAVFGVVKDFTDRLNA
jgi:hypothetical protein